MITAAALLCFALTVSSKFVMTPVGLRDSACVHHVPSGSVAYETVEGTEIYDSVGVFVKTVAHCNSTDTKAPAPGAYDGWLGFTSYKTTDLDKFLGYFTVPVKPKSVPEVLYIFTGLQNVDWIPVVDPEPNVFDIIQPVLQYPGNNGNYWSVKSWYVTLTNDVLYTDEIEVDVGDSIFGNMTKTSSTKWVIEGTSVSSGKSVKLTVAFSEHSRAFLQHQPWAYNTVECYGCDGGCDYLPTNTLNFTQLDLSFKNELVTANWTVRKSPNAPCPTTGHVVNSTEVYFTFG